MQFRYCTINFQGIKYEFDENALSRNIIYDFKVRLNQEECQKDLRLEYGNDFPSRETVFIQFT